MTINLIFERVRTLFLTALLSVTALPCGAAKAVPVSPARAEWQATIAEMSGTVYFKPADGLTDWAAPDANLPLETGDLVRTGADGMLRLSYDGEGVIELGPSSSLKIGKLDYADASLSLDDGSLLGKLKNIFSRKRRFAVHTSAAVCAVRGTEFAVEYSSATDETVAGVFDEGEIAVGRPGDEETAFVPLKAGQEAQLRRGAEIKARNMQKLAQRKAALSAMLARQERLRANWKLINTAKRSQLRAQFAERVAQRQRAITGKQEQRKQRAAEMQERRKKASDAREQRRQKALEMQEKRQQMRQRTQQRQPQLEPTRQNRPSRQGRSGRGRSMDTGQ